MVKYQTFGQQNSSDYSVLVIPTPLKNMKVRLGRIIPYMTWQIKFMFQTTKPEQHVG
jgi:regulation of enolase protein 1 (concanavalin A-like superfamily)